MKKIILLIVTFSLFSLTIHKLHLSLTKVVYKPESKTIQTTMRLFIDDIETAINTKYQIESEMDTDREVKNLDELLQNYISENFSIIINNQKIPLHYLGKEYDQDIVYIYFENNINSNIKSISVENKILFNIYNDQQNLVKIRTPQVKKTLFFKPSHTQETIIIK